MKRKLLIPVFFVICLFTFTGVARAYLLSPVYVLKKMIANYRAIQGIAVTQTLEAYGEDTLQPFASLDEKVEMHPLVPMKIWVDGKLITRGSDLPPEMGANRFLIESQRRYGFYKDVFLNHDINLLKALLERLGVTALRDKLCLLYPLIAYQVGDIDENDASPAGIWIEKDRFIPLKLAGSLSGQQNGDPYRETIAIHYGAYRFIRGKIWFPFDITFYVNDKLALRIQAHTVTLTTD